MSVVHRAAQVGAVENVSVYLGLDQFNQHLSNLKEVRIRMEESYAYYSNHRIAARVDVDVAS
jgi:hypothetical protein